MSIEIGTPPGTPAVAVVRDASASGLSDRRCAVLRPWSACRSAVGAPRLKGALKTCSPEPPIPTGRLNRAPRCNGGSVCRCSHTFEP